MDKRFWTFGVVVVIVVVVAVFVPVYCLLVVLVGGPPDWSLVVSGWCVVRWLFNLPHIVTSLSHLEVNRCNIIK